MDNVRRGVAVSVMVGLGLALSAIPVFAFDMRSGDAVTVGSGETVNEDLYLAGRTVGSDGTVKADVFAAGQTVTIGGTVSDGVTAAGQTVIIGADVGNGVRAAGSTVDVSGMIGRDLVAGCSSLTVAQSASIAGDLGFGASTAVISGNVGGDVQGAAESVVIAGTIGGNVDLKVGTLQIDPGANIGGNLTYTGSKEASIPSGVVRGSVTFTQREENARDDMHPGLRAIGPLAIFAGLTWRLIAYLMAFVTGLVLILLCPKRMAGASSAIRTATGSVAGYGAIALFLTPLAALVVCVTIVGIPVGIITMLLWGILLYLSQLPVSVFIGHMILGAHKPLESKGFMIGSLALGLLLISLLRLIPLLGFLVALATALFGMGAFVIGERRRMQLNRARGDSSLS